MSLVGTPSQAVSAPNRPLCLGHGLKVEVNFARAAASACSIRRNRGQVAVEILVRPETVPINRSPWYGVRFLSRRSQSVEVTLDYGSFKHRYHPHIAPQVGDWTRIASEDVTSVAAGGKALIAMQLPVGTTYLAAQPYDPPAFITRFLDGKVTTGALVRTSYGQSIGGLPLVSYRNVPPSPSGTLILLTRQHPPEVAGEWAFDAFVAALLEDNEQAKAFRVRFGLLILPILNPDGIARGFWRSGGGLIDLNRDWGPFTQPETKAAAAHILAVTAQAPAIAMIDFHATNRDVIYAQPLSTDLAPAGLVDGWLLTWTNALGPTAPKIDRAHNASSANSKTWGRLTLGIAAITYEVGDETPRDVAQARARLAAELFMAQALAMPQPAAKVRSSANGAQR